MSDTNKTSNYFERIIRAVMDEVIKLQADQDGLKVENELLKRQLQAAYVEVQKVQQERNEATQEVRELMMNRREKKKK